ncbi:MAG: flavin monoamine oxidase family protein [Gemmatimonadaceae bacterium]
MTDVRGTAGARTVDAPRADTLTADVVVIGAGAAGLAAAGALAAAGLRVILLEARERIGGRVHTLRDPASPVAIELGAEFVHGRPPVTWELLDAMAQPIVEMQGDHLLADGTALYSPPEDVEREYGSVFAKLDPKRTPDRSFAEAVADCCGSEEWSERRAMAFQFVEGFHGAHPERVSERALALGTKREAEIGERRGFRLPGGYDALIGALAARAPAARLGCVVTRVAWNERGVEVEAGAPGGAGLRVRARRAVVTLPLGVLKAAPDEEGAVRFEPPLESRRAALDLVEVGAAARVVLLFRDRVWEDAALARHGAGHDLSRLAFFYARTDAAFPVWWTQYPVVAPVITGWVGGPGAERLAGLPPDAMLDVAVATLARLLGAEPAALRERLAGAWSHDWRSDPFARGAYAYVAVGGLDAPRALGAPIAGTLFFAGEATAGPGDIGTVHGAIATGRRAAAELLAATRREPGARAEAGAA